MLKEVLDFNWKLLHVDLFYHRLREWKVFERLVVVAEMLSDRYDDRCAEQKAKDESEEDSSDSSDIDFGKNDL